MLHRVNLNGFTMLLHGDNYLEEEIVKAGVWEPETTAVFHEIIEPGMVIVDVGANIGYFTLLSAFLTRAKGSVHAFEPYPQYRNRLMVSLECNSFEQVKVVPCALSDEVVQRNLYKGLASARMEKWTHENPVFNEIHDTITVDCVRLDDYANECLDRIDVLKIDVDGHEMKVLSGGERAIERFKPIVIIELYEQALLDAGTSVSELLHFFNEHDYTPYSEQGDMLDYNSLNEYVKINPERSVNVVLVS